MRPLRNLSAVMLALSLGGCVSPASILGDSLASFRPYIMDLKNGPQYEDDRGKCLEVARDYSTPLDVQSVASAGLSGGASNAGGAAAAGTVIVVAAGAAGSATAQVLKGLGISSEDQLKVFAWCMKTKGDDSRAYRVVDPHL